MEGLMWKKGEKFEVIHDPRGDIIPVAEGEFRSVMIIKSDKGTVRANHWHKTDSHVMYVFSGRMLYYEEIHGIITQYELFEGDSVVTEAGIPHAVKFVEDTTLIVCTRNPRDFEAYAEDTVKCELIDVH